MDKFICDMMAWMNERYGVNLRERRAKLHEEFAEFDAELAKYENGEGNEMDVIHEAGDVIVVMLHILTIVGSLSVKMLWTFLNALIVSTHWKNVLRVDQPDYGRKHPHERNARAGE